MGGGREVRVFSERQQQQQQRQGSVATDMPWQWAEEPVDIADLTRRCHMPVVAKLDGDDYGNFGTGTQLDLDQPFLLYTIRRCSKVLAASVLWDERQQQYEDIGPTLLIPVNYPGWFHAVEEDAEWKGQINLRSIKKVVEEKPSNFLSTTPMTCYSLSRQSHNGNLIYGEEATPAGELFKTGDICSKTIDGYSDSCMSWICGRKAKATEQRYLCCSDTIGRELLVPFNTKGTFYKVARSGVAPSSDYVFQLTDVVRSRPLPMIIKLVHGDSPSAKAHFTGLVRLDEVFCEESVIACSLGDEEFTLLELPTDSKMKLIPAVHSRVLIKNRQVQNALSYCGTNLDQYMTTIKVTQSFYPEHVDGQKEDVQEKSPDKAPRPPLPRLPQSDDPDEHNTDSSAEAVDDSDAGFDSDEFDDSETEDEPIYETIPTDNAEGNQPKSSAEDEEGYLVPLSVRSKRHRCTSNDMRKGIADTSVEERTPHADNNLKSKPAEKRQIVQTKLCHVDTLNETPKYITEIRITDAVDTVDTRDTAKNVAVSHTPMTRSEDTTVCSSFQAENDEDSKVQLYTNYIPTLPKDSLGGHDLSPSNVGSKNEENLDNRSENTKDTCAIDATEQDTSVEDIRSTSDSVETIISIGMFSSGHSFENVIENDLVADVSAMETNSDMDTNRSDSIGAATDTFESIEKAGNLAGTGSHDTIQDKKSLDSAESDEGIEPFVNDTIASEPFNEQPYDVSEIPNFETVATTRMYSSTPRETESVTGTFENAILDTSLSTEEPVLSTTETRNSFHEAESFAETFENVAAEMFTIDTSIGTHLPALKDEQELEPTDLETEEDRNRPGLGENYDGYVTNTTDNFDGTLDISSDHNSTRFEEKEVNNTELHTRDLSEESYGDLHPSVDPERLDAFLDDSVQEFQRRTTSETWDDGEQLGVAFSVGSEEPSPVPTGSDTYEDTEEPLDTKADFDAFLEEVFNCAAMDEGIYSPLIKRRAQRRLHSFSGPADGGPGLERCLTVSRSFSQTDLHSKDLTLADDSLLHDIEPFQSQAAGNSSAPNQAEQPKAFEENGNGDNSPNRSTSPSLSSIYQQMRIPPARTPCSKCSRKLSRADSGVYVDPRGNSDTSVDDSCQCTCQRVSNGSEWTWSPPDDVGALSVEEVTLCLRYIGMKETIVERFADEQIDGKQLTDLNDELLRDGFSELNSFDRKKVLDFVGGWRPKKSPSIMDYQVVLEASQEEYAA